MVFSLGESSSEGRDTIPTGITLKIRVLTPSCGLVFPIHSLHCLRFPISSSKKAALRPQGSSQFSSGSTIFSYSDLMLLEDGGQGAPLSPGEQGLGMLHCLDLPCPAQGQSETLDEALLIYFCNSFIFFGLWIISGWLVTYAPYKTENPAFLAGCEAYVRHSITACVFVCLCAGGCGSGRGAWAVLQNSHP